MSTSNICTTCNGKIDRFAERRAGMGARFLTWTTTSLSSMSHTSLSGRDYVSKTNTKMTEELPVKKLSPTQLKFIEYIKQMDKRTNNL
jgi:hypothetical protein